MSKVYEYYYYYYQYTTTHTYSLSLTASQYIYCTVYDHKHLYINSTNLKRLYIMFLFPNYIYFFFSPDFLLCVPFSIYCNILYSILYAYSEVQSSSSIVTVSLSIPPGFINYYYYYYYDINQCLLRNTERLYLHCIYHTN